MSEYRVKFEVFEGPLDLLLYLIRREEVDIYQVNLTRIATQFIEYLNLMRELDLDIAGEFVVMAATLMLIKSRELLPREQRPDDQTSPEDELNDPRWELIRQLVEYRKFKDAASRLQSLEQAAENTYARCGGVASLPPAPLETRPEATIFDLLSAVTAILKRFAEKAAAGRDVFEDKWSVSEKIESMLSLVRTRRSLRFSELFDNTTSRAEVVVTFLALLELIRLRFIVAAQPEQFAEIQIELAPAPDEASAPEGEKQGEPAEASAESTATEPANTPPAAESADPARWN